jgi:hypothetical protein
VSHVEERSPGGGGAQRAAACAARPSAKARRQRQRALQQPLEDRLLARGTNGTARLAQASRLGPIARVEVAGERLARNSRAAAEGSPRAGRARSADPPREPAARRPRRAEAVRGMR